MFHFPRIARYKKEEKLFEFTESPKSDPRLIHINIMIFERFFSLDVLKFLATNYEA